MSLPRKTDFLITKDGDLITHNRVSSDGNVLTDLALVKEREQSLQSIDIRLKSKIKDFVLHPEIGNALMDIVGKRSNKDTAEIGKRYIVSAITDKNYIGAEHIEVSYIPLSNSKITYIIKVLTDSKESFNVVLELDLKNGFRRVV